MNLRDFDKKCCEDFQNSLNEVSILKIWKNFREAGNSIEGRIIKLVIFALFRISKKCLTKTELKMKSF
jgi:hypothetical protein